MSSMICYRIAIGSLSNRYRIAIPPLVEDEVERKDQHKEPVAHITEHDPEEEGVGDDGKGSRVNLAISRHTVPVDDALRSIDAHA